MRKYRVIQWATGNVGLVGLRGVIEHPALELVGLWCYSGDKEGLDAGELLGIEPTGIRATRDIEALLALDADCVNYMPIELMRDPLDKPENIIDELSRILSAGINVACTTVALAWPESLPPDLFEKLKEACETGHSTIYCTGVTPDAHQSITATVLSMCRDIECIVNSEMLAVDTFVLMTTVLGIGLPPEEFVAQSESLSGLWPTVYGPVLQQVAHGLGEKITSFRSQPNAYVLAEHPIDIASGRVEKGTVRAYRTRVEGLIDNVVRFEHNGMYWVGDYPSEWGQPPLCASGVERLEVKGSPGIAMEYHPVGSDEPALTDFYKLTGLRCVNAIPSVCEADPGIVTFRDLPNFAPPVSWHSSA